MLSVRYPEISTGVQKKTKTNARTRARTKTRTRSRTISDPLRPIRPIRPRQCPRTEARTRREQGREQPSDPLRPTQTHRLRTLTKYSNSGREGTENRSRTWAENGSENRSQTHQTQGVAQVTAYRERGPHLFDFGEQLWQNCGETVAKL